MAAKRKGSKRAGRDAAGAPPPAPAAGASAAKPARPLPRVPLSSLLKTCPQHFDESKISAVEKFITDIDTLPERYQSARTLYLSKNSLRRLDGIEQFRSLRVLSAKDNLIDDYSELSLLRGLPLLESASFEGNPMTQLPYYR